MSLPKSIKITEEEADMAFEDPSFRTPWPHSTHHSTAAIMVTAGGQSGETAQG